MWGRSSKQRKSAVRRRAAVAVKESTNRDQELRRRAYEAGVRNGMKRAKRAAAKRAIKFKKG